jgi:hypothetical protein
MMVARPAAHVLRGALLQVIAASALVIEESRRLLEMAEPAWTYDR